MSLFARNRQRDPVADQLRSLARQGATTAKVAHGFAGLLIVLFSAASFVALAGDAFTRFLVGWRAGQVDIPSAISVAVSLLIVPAFDMGMLYAANIVRIMATRRTPRRDMAVHAGVIFVTCCVEGAAYIYMSAVYEHPTTIPAWAIISVRGLTAPLLAVYLAMARPLPVTARDIMYQGELTSGAGMLRDVAAAANDPNASLSDKMALYSAAAVMTAEDRWRLDSMIAVVQGQRRMVEGALATGMTLPAPLTPGPLPTGPGTPSSSNVENEPETQAGSGFADSPRQPSRALLRTVRRQGPRKLRARAADQSLDDQRRVLVNELLNRDAEMKPNALANAINAANLGPIGWHTAARLKAAWERRQTTRMRAAQ